MKRLIFILITAIYFIIPLQQVYAEAIDINAPSYILVEPGTGQVLAEKASNEIHYPASTTKIMTAILAIEMSSPDTIMTASQAAVNDIGEGGSNIGIMAGEKLTLEQLLKALLVSSANESANIIAENVCSNFENPRAEFIKLMNRRARELGAVNTHFVNPCGIHDPEHYTTVGDMAKLASHAMTLPLFREIVRTTHYTLPATNKHESWDSLVVTNKFLNPLYGGHYKPESFTVTGIKTGFTTPAGNCLVTSAVNKEGEELLAVVYGVTSTDSLSNVYAGTTRLLEWGFSSFDVTELVPEGKVVKNVVFDGARGDKSTNLIAKNAFSYLLPVDKEQWNIEEKVHWEKPFTAPAIKGQKTGYLEIKSDGKAIGRISLITQKEVEQKLYLQIVAFFGRLVTNNSFKKLAFSITLTLAMFLILRISLRHISRSIKANRQQN